MVDSAFLLEFDGPPGFSDAFLDHHRIDHVVYARSATPEWYHAAEARGIMRRLPCHDGLSTSGIIARIRDRADL